MWINHNGQHSNGYGPTFRLTAAEGFLCKRWQECSKLYLWGSPFWVRFLCMWSLFFFFFFYQTIGVVTVCLHGWCMVSVFLLSTFIHLGHLLLHSPAISLRFTIFDEIFAHVTVCNPTTEVVILHLCGWRMLGVFLLPVLTCLGHECQDLLSLCDGMHVCTD